MSDVLVTGAGGFLGSALSRALGSSQHDISVHGFDNDSRGSLESLRADCPRFFAWRGSVTDAEGVEHGFGQTCPDAVWHLAARNGTRNFYENPYEVLDIQIRGTLNVIDACVRHDVKTLVLFSSSEAYQTPPIIPTPEDVPLVVPDLTNPRYSYGGSKIAAELLAWHSPIEKVVICRPHNVFGPSMGFDHVIPQFIMRAARTPNGGRFDIHGATTRSFIYIDDFTDAMMAIWKNVSAREGRVREVFHVGTEEQVSTVALAGMISDIMGRKQADRYAYKFKTHPAPAGGTPARCPDTRKVRGLGWEPKVPLREGLERTVAAYRACADAWPKEAT